MKKKIVDDINPLGIFLVKSGSKGERLLFRYPYWIDDNIESVSRRKKRNPYGVMITEDPLNSPRIQPRPSELCDQQLVGQTSFIPDALVFTTLSGKTCLPECWFLQQKIFLNWFSDKVLSNLFAVKADLCGKKFELKVNDFRFVGHPTLLFAPNTSMSMFNIVFALKASASQSVVECIHDFTQRLAIVLQHEERRCGYLSSQAKRMLTILDEFAAMPEAEVHESPYKKILSASQLAKDLQAAFQELTEKGEVHLQIQNWIEVSFCLPHRVHLVHNKNMVIGPDTIKNCLAALRPYHGLLLLRDPGELMESFPQDASPALIRLIQEASPLKSLQRLAADADLTLSQVFQLTGHLVYWAKAIFIYPLCESNVYVVSPNASLSMNSALAEKFAEHFDGNSLLALLSEFSLPTSLSQLSSPMQSPYQQAQQIQMVVWLLQHGLLMQMHTYVYLISSAHQPPSFSMGGASSSNSSVFSPDKPYQSSFTDGNSADELIIFEQTSNPSDFGSSVSSEECLTSSLGQSGTEHSKSVSDEDLSERDSLQLVHSLLMHLTPAERECIKKVPASEQVDDLRLFARLSAYFNGKHHLEEIMYNEDVRRSQLLALIDKFRDVLITCQHEDPAVTALMH